MERRGEEGSRGILIKVTARKRKSILNVNILKKDPGMSMH